MTLRAFPVVPAARFALAGALAGALVLGSCRQLADVEELSPCDGAETSDGCASCRSEACCSALLACRADRECAALDACLEGCAGVEACRGTCRAQHPTALREPFAALSGCSAAACGAACNSDGYLFAEPECAACARLSCATELDACSTSIECLSLAYLEQPCASHDHGCRGKLERKLAAGAAGARTLVECLANGCAEECGYVPQFSLDWSCAGKGVGSGDPLTLGITLKRIVKNTGSPDDDFEPAVGAEVRVCDAADADCAAPLVETAVDEEGKAVVELPYGFEGYFDYRGGGLTPFIEYFDWRLLVVVSQPPEGYTPNTFTPELGQAIFAHLGLDATLGELFVRQFDCHPLPQTAPGLSFRLNPAGPNAQPYYGVLAEQDTTLTGLDGSGGFLNLDPGSYEVSSIDRETGQCVGRKQVWVRAGTRTQVLLMPSSCNP